MRPGRPPVPEGPVLVVGLARSGIGAALALRDRGTRVVACDTGPAAPLDGVEVHPGTSGEGLLQEVAWVVKSPGVPATAPAVAAARARGLPVLGELELGWRLLPNPFVAVTGTNGKTTTAEWIGHLHRRAGVPVVVAGNVGTALTSLAATLARETVVVCEASSFQLEDTVAFAPDAAVLLNLGEDHLDRHGSVAAYHAAKLRIFAQQSDDAVAVLPEALVPLAGGGAARRVAFGAGDAALLRARGDRLWWRDAALIDLDDLALPGAHNLENAMATAAVCLARGMGTHAVRDGLGSFGGVAHRLEEVAVREGVRYVNDSKATNVGSAVVGLSSFAPGSVHVILGGRAKGDDLAPLAAAVTRHARAAYLVGESAPLLRGALAATGVPLHASEDLERAVAAARAAARPGEVVLLSPAAASYDQYASFEERGAHFRALAAEGRGAAPGGEAPT